VPPAESTALVAMVTSRSLRLSEPIHHNFVDVDMGVKMTNHSMADSSLREKDAKWALATVLRGPFEDRIVSIMIEYLDGWCICDMGMGPDDDIELPMEIIHINDLRPWIRVESVDTRDGKLNYKPVE
jgi:hypothetical protein